MAWSVVVCELLTRAKPSVMTSCGATISGVVDGLWFVVVAAMSLVAAALRLFAAVLEAPGTTVAVVSAVVTAMLALPPIAQMRWGRSELKVLPCQGHWRGHAILSATLLNRGVTSPILKLLSVHRESAMGGTVLWQALRDSDGSVALGATLATFRNGTMRETSCNVPESLSAPQFVLLVCTEGRARAYHSNGDCAGTLGPGRYAAKIIVSYGPRTDQYLWPFEVRESYPYLAFDSTLHATRADLDNRSFEL